VKAPTCVDCIAEGVTTHRPTASGTRKPRCATHTRTARKRARLNAHARTVETAYGITGEQYWALYGAQGGKCAICRIATGKTKRLAVDHDHRVARDTCGHDPRQGCPRCIRGLACGRCNQFIGQWNAEVLVRALEYLLAPPARKLLNGPTRPETGQETPSK